MITSNTSIPFIKAENSENKFYLSQLTSEYNEGDVITTSTDINCRKLAIALKAGDKITINGTSLTIYADAAVDATSFFVEAITLDEALEINANIAIDEDNMFVQYQRKTEGTVAGFDIDADGISKGGVEITGWLDSDTMEGATANNIPTAESVKAYVDGQVGTADTLSEVLALGNTSGSNDIIMANNQSYKGTNTGGAAYGLLTLTSGNEIKLGAYDYTSAGVEIGCGDHARFLIGITEKMRLTSTGLGIGTTSPGEKLEVDGNIKVGDNDEIKFGTDDDLKMYHNATDSYIENETGNLYIKNNANDKDIIFQSDDGSGGTTEYLSLDGSDVNIKVRQHMVFTDNKRAYFGGGADLSIYHDGTNNQILANNGHLTIEVGEDDHSMYLKCDNGSGGTTAYLTLDGGQETVNVYKNLLIGTTTDSGYKLDVSGQARVQDVLELDDVLTLNGIATPDDPADGKSSIYMDSSTGDIKVKINLGGEVVTRTLASYDG